MRINKEKRYIEVVGGQFGDEDVGTTNILYDLIKSDLVEKVD